MANKLGKLGRLIAKWKRVYLRFKPLELQVESARHAVRDAFVAGGLEEHEGVKLVHQERIDWEAMARAIIAPAYVEQLKPMFTKVGAPYVRAPHDWGVEARATKE